MEAVAISDLEEEAWTYFMAEGIGIFEIFRVLVVLADDIRAIVVVGYAANGIGVVERDVEILRVFLVGEVAIAEHLVLAQPARFHHSALDRIEIGIVFHSWLHRGGQLVYGHLD